MKFTVFSPATIGNLASGFDVLGLAVDQLGDLFHFEASDRYSIAVSGRDAALVPLSPEENTVCLAAKHFYQLFGQGERPFSVHLERHLPISGGLGSSAASSVAGAMGAAQLADAGDRLDLVMRAALFAESIVAGPHLDNIAPCIFGGLTLVQDVESLKVYSIPLQADFWITLVTPGVKVQTKEARKVLASSLTTAEWTRQMAHCTTLAVALARGDAEQLAYGLIDQFAEPARSRFIPGFDAAKKMALAAGAYGFSLSGSGPTCFALSPSRSVAESIAQALPDLMGSEASVHVVRPRSKGAEVLR